MCLVGHTCNDGTPLWSVGNFTTSSQSVWKTLFSALATSHAFVMKCCVYCIALCLILVLLTSFTYLVYAHLTCSSWYTSTLYPLLAHHHLCYVNVCYVFDLTFVLLYYIFTFLMCIVICLFSACCFPLLSSAMFLACNYLFM